MCLSNRPVAASRWKELAACVRIARCAWAPAAFLTLAHSIARYAGDSKTYRIDHDARPQQSTQQSIDEGPSRRTTAHTDWRGLWCPHPHNSIQPCALKQNTQEPPRGPTVTRCLEQQISTTNWFVTHFSLSRRLRNTQKRSRRTGAEKATNAHLIPRIGIGGQHEIPLTAISFNPFPLAEAGATVLVDPTDQSLGPPLRDARIWPLGPGWLGLTTYGAPLNPHLEGSIFARRSRRSVTKLMQANSPPFYPSHVWKPHTDTPDRAQKDSAKAQVLAFSCSA